LLHELVPAATSVGVLLNPAIPQTGKREFDAAARALGLRVDFVEAMGEGDIGAVFAKLAELRSDALLVPADPVFRNMRADIVARTIRARLPAMFSLRDYAAIGGLMSDGADLADGYRRAGIYAGRILAGAKVADLPVEQSEKFALVINMKTAKAIGIAVPPQLLARADEVIE